MTVEVEVRGVRLRRLAPDDPNATMPPQTYFEFNFAHITRGTLLGAQSELIIDGKPFVGPWPWQWVAGWLLGKTKLGQPHESDEIQERWVERVRGWFLAEPLNAPLRRHLFDTTVPTRVPEEDPLLGGFDFQLFLLYDFDGLVSLRHWYDRRLETVKKETYDEQTARLRETVGAAIGKARKKIARVRKDEVEPLTGALQKLQVGDLTFQVMFDFAKPKAERVRLWGSEGEPQYVVPEPPAERRVSVGELRAAWKNELVRPCAKLVSQALPSAVDPHAADILRQMRADNGAVLTMFRQWDTLCQAAQAELVETTLEGLRIALMGKKTRASVIDSEFMALGAAASELGKPVGPSQDDPRSQALATAIENFDPAILLPQEAETPLGTFLADHFKSARDMSTHGAVALDVLGMATPHIVRKLKTYNLTGALDSAWLWRAAVGTGQLSEGVQKDFWGRLGRVMKGKGLPDGAEALPVPLIKLERGALSQSIQDSAAAWKTLAVLVDCLAVAEVAHQQRNADVDQALRELAAITNLMKDSMDFVSMQADIARLLDHTSDAELKALSKEFSSTRAVPVIGLIADGLSFAVSVRDAHRAQKKWSKESRARAIREAFFDGLSLAATVVGLAIGSELVILAMLLYGAKELLEDPEIWVPYVPFSTMVRKPGPHRYLEGLLKSMDDDETVRKLLDKPNAAGLGQRLAYWLNRYERTILEGMPPELWDIGGAPGMHLDRPAKIILRRHYSYPAEARKVIVMPSLEGH